MSLSRVVLSPDEARDALAEPGDALDLRAHASPGPGWTQLGFRTLVPGELVREVPVPLPDLAATRALGARLAPELRPGDLLVLTGPLGAGKTSLTQGLGAALGVQGSVTSPTFVLARAHRGPLPLTHVDAYRLRDAAGGVAGAVDLDDLDLDLALEQGVVVVEWGEQLVEELADSRLEVLLEPTPDGERRTARVRAVGPRWATSPG